jgi:hypothetical protein
MIKTYLLLLLNEYQLRITSPRIQFQANLEQ